MAAVLAAMPVFAQTSPATPPKPSDLSETYEDWTVNCVNRDDKRDCAMSQVQANKNGQRVLGVELRSPDGKSLRGSLVLPFGLRLERGATFAVDDMPPGAATRFRTCLPVGCLITLIFTDKTVQSLRSGTTLKIVTISNDNEAEVPFSVSLRGLNAALDRMLALTKGN